MSTNLSTLREGTRRWRIHPRAERTAGRPWRSTIRRSTPWSHLARLGGVAGSPPASSGEVTVLGPIDVPHYVRGFDISPSGEAYLLAHSEDWTEARLYRLNLETLGTEDLGAIATPSPGEDFVYAIAAAPQGLGPSVVEIPAVSRTGLALLAMLLAAAALLRARRLP